MNRREFVTLLGSAAAWPLAARAQQSERMRRIGMLMGLTEDNPQTRLSIDAFVQRLRQLGWSEGHNVQIDYRWGESDADRIRRSAADLVGLRLT